MENKIYVVESGDTLAGIAQKFGVDFITIARYNGIADPDNIEAGRVLRIPAQDQENVYIVRKGDTLYSIAKMYGTTVEELVLLNSLSGPDVIIAGQKLIIPKGENISFYVVKTGDTLFEIAQRFDTTVEALADVNGIADPDVIEAGQVIRIPSEGYIEEIKKYTVRKGDTLWKIAQKTGMPVSYLININRLAQPDFIYPGQVLIIRQD